MNAGADGRRFHDRWWTFPAAALLFAVAIGAGGWLLFRAERAGWRRAAQNELAAIADMKVDLIARWMAERRGDAELAREKALALWLLGDVGDGSLREPVLRWMDTLRRTADYAVVALFDASGRLILDAPAGAAGRYADVPDHVRAALRSKDVTFSDLHRAGPGQPIYLSFLVPVGDPSRIDRPPAGVLLLAVDPSRFLFPLIQNWPIPSRTAETLLVRREDHDVLFLNELRHRKDTALSLRVPLEGGLAQPATRAIQGFEGLMEGDDYRGIPVLAVARRVPGTPWFMVAKVDRDEIYAQVHRETWIAGLIAGLLYLTALLGTGYALHRQRLTIARRQLAESVHAETLAREGESAKQRQLEDAEESRKVLLSILEDRKAFEDALRMSEAQLSDALRLARAGHWEYDVASDTFTLNDNFYRIFRTTAAEVGGYRMSSAEYARRFCHPDDIPLVGQEVQAAIASPDPAYSRQVEHRIIYADGTPGHLSVRFFILKDAQGRTVKTFGVNQDITERVRRDEEAKRIEAQLQQQQKLESIGVLASGVAHEINNPINGILNYAQLIADRIGTAQPPGEYAAEIMKECDRVSSIVHNLLAFARHEKQAHSPARIEDILNATLSLIRTVLRHDQIRIDVEIEPGLPTIKCRSQQIEQVILNLLTNARDALDERFPGFDENKAVRIDVRPFEKESKRWIRIAVENDGTPVPAESRTRLFEPFYTTKTRDQGTGLGLSISYGIVKEHHGEIYLASEPGQPTRFHLDLPVDNGWQL